MELYFEDIQVGQEMPTLVAEPINKIQQVMYAGASGDFNALHLDDDFAKALGMQGGVITAGMQVMGKVGQAITDWVPKKYLKKFGVRFSGITKPGNIITVTGKVIDKQASNQLITCEVTAQDETGNVKITGRFEAVLPSKSKNT